ncbi:hypothetical protein N0B40_02160 [Chryseobacterium oranimense]|uniref:hypothetical protein n=1 Tax=Chryseobacterium oranimense TaxID=421058 RepID=UPI0021AFF498|nr:hypothetical protein [Chryseobacterium oranimense]UWX61085.1 hypothetical protein N0B40_02160 [Chryseobacterium oranimense]
MKNRVLLFLFAMFFTALCAGFFAGKGKTQSYFGEDSKTQLFKHVDQQGQPEIYNVSDDQGTQDSGDFEKVKFDYAITTQQWLNFFFTSYSYHTPIAAVQNRVHITAPRYILYHSLQIAGC